jgi:hypothetical protein
VAGTPLHSTLRVVAALALAAAGAAFATSGAHAATTRPIFVSVKATSPTGFPLPAAGAPVTLTVLVKNAKTCTFLSQRSTASSIYPMKTVSCASGHAKMTLPAIANNRGTPVLLEYAVRAKSASGKTAIRGVFVHQAAAPQAPTAQLGTSTQALPSSGGAVNFTFNAANATSCTLTATPALWPGANPQTVSCNGTYSTTVAPASLLPQVWKIVFTATSATGKTATALVPLSEQGAPGQPATVAGMSTNWGGYSFRTGGAAVTQVAGDWIVPVTNCAKTPNGGASTWVGIGGDQNDDGSSTGDLLQTGVDTDCSNGSEVTRAWWELVPSDPNHSWSFDMVVAPGDHISASVFQAPGGYWETRVDDLTTGQSGVMETGIGWGVTSDTATTFQPTQSLTFPYTGGTSAEWIEEDYTLNDSLVPFCDFQSVTFVNLSSNAAGWALNDGSSITLVDSNGNPLAFTSVPIGGAQGFSVAYNG